MSATTTPAPTLPALDFTRRLDPALLPEQMDEPCSYEDFRGCVRDIAATTALTGAYAPTLQFVQRAIAARQGTKPLHIVDVGSGGGDMLRRIARWAQQHGHPVRLTGIDLNPHATRAAQEFAAGDRTADQIEWCTGDLFTERAVQVPDLVLSSLVTHHMRDAEIVQFLSWMEAHAEAGWFISDLVRSPRAYRTFGVLARVMRWHPFVRHDGLVSIRRAFREEDWQRLLDGAGLSPDVVSLRRCAIGRLCVGRLR